MIERLAREAIDTGVELRADSAVVGVDAVGSVARGVNLESGASIAADAVLVAAGSWTPALLPHLGDRLWSTAQTVLRFRPRRPERFAAPRFPVWAAGTGPDGWYGFPTTGDGLVKVANHGVGRRLPPDGDRTAPAADEARFRAFLASALPELAEAPLAGSRVCLYSDSWDGDFLIDRDPACAGLFVACGGSGHGFKFAPSLGAIIADAVEGRENRWSSRFRWRARAAGSAARK